MRSPKLERIILSAVVALLLLGAGAANAQVPTRVPFQGLLLDSGGAPLNASVDLDFELFDAVAAGSSLWQESHLGVIVVDGVYSVDLGTTTPLTQSVLAGGSAFLEITVGGEVLVPRQQFMSVPYALVANEAATLVGVPGAFFEEIVEHVNFDGGGPPNLDPSEGFGDTDLDGLANFVDPDNDNDGISDIDEFANGRDINLLSPDISSVTPTEIRAYKSATLTVVGTNLDTTSAVTFGAESPTPVGLTATGFSIDVSAQTLAAQQDVVATITNGQSDSNGVTIRPITPVITSVVPNVTNSYMTTNLFVTGTDLDFVTSVDFGLQTFTPTNVTETGFQVEVLPETLATSLSVVANLSYGGSVDSASSNPVFLLAQPPVITSSPGFLQAGLPHAITILGANFYAGTVVEIDGQTLTPTALTSSSIDVTLPALSEGSYSLDVVHPNTLVASAPYIATPGGGSRVAFLSSPTSGVLGGLSGGDAICAADATANGLPAGTYLAWLSDGTDSPATRFDLNAGPYALPDGTPIAANWADLTDGALLTPINQLADGVTTLNSWVFTGTNSDGTSVSASADGENCVGWTSAGSTGVRGQSGDIGTTWSNVTSIGCSVTVRLYCFQN